MNELINKDNEWIIHFMGSLDRLLDNVEHLTASYRPTLNGERFFTDKEVSARLKVSRRTLQDYRNEGRIAYIQLGGKILYRESDIERMLTDSYRTAYRQTAICDSNGTIKKERLTDEASMFSFVCKPFLLFLLISRQSLVSVAGCPKCVWLAGARFSG